MAAPVWPASLPQKMRRSGFAFVVGENKLEAVTDSGLIRTALTTRSRVDEVSGVFRMTESQLTTFETFYDAVIASGVLDFDLPQQIPLGDATWRVKIKGTFQTVPATFNRYDVRLQLRIMP